MRRKSFSDYADTALKCGFRGRMTKAEYEDLDDDEYSDHMDALGKAEDEYDDDDDDDERDPDEEKDQREDPDPDEDDAEKSLDGLTQDDLLKAMDAILGAARTAGKTGEQIRLEDLSKAALSRSLTARERAEMVGLLESDSTSAAADSFAKSMDADPDVQAAVALDATDMVASMIEAISKSLSGVGDELNDLRKSTGDFNRRLAEGFDLFARTVDKQLRAMAEQNEALTDRLQRVEKSAVPYRGRVSAPRTPMSAVHDPRAPQGPLSKGAQVPTRVAKLVALDILEKSQSPSERSGLSALVCRLDTYHGQDWQSLPEATSDPALTAKVIAQATA